MSAPRSTEWVWGIDVASSKLGVGFIDATGRCPDPEWTTLQVPKQPDLGLRLIDLEGRLERLVDAERRRFPPIAVLVELPVGRFPAPTLVAAWGVTVKTLRELLPERILLASDITPVMWKKGLRMKGNADKAACMAFARSIGYGGDDQDCADALCVACYGARELNRPQLPRAA